MKNIKSYLLIGLAVGIATLVACGVLLEIDISNDQIQLFAPSDSVTIEGPDVTFRWEELEGATSYEIVVVSPSFDQIEKVDLDTNIVGQKTTSFTALLEKGDYQWSATAKNSGYYTAPQIRTFFVKEDVEDTLIIKDKDIIVISPKDNSSTSNTNILFKWEEVLGAHDYVLKAYLDENVDELVVNQILQVPEHTAALGIGDYYWEVRARNPKDSTDLFTFKFSVIEEPVGQ